MLKTGTIIILSIIFLSFMVPEELIIPVKHATKNDWNQSTFWAEPWGESGVHKGIDIFAPKGKEVVSSIYGIVISIGKANLGGNYIVILGPKCHLHYYAHLEDVNTSLGKLVSTSDVIGTIGNSGNAKGKVSQLHYEIWTPLPYIWRWDSSTQGWKKMFYINPIQKLLNC